MYGLHQTQRASRSKPNKYTTKNRGGEKKGQKPKSVSAINKTQKSHLPLTCPETSVHQTTCPECLCPQVPAAAWVRARGGLQAGQAGL